ncbi:response regulator [Desulfoplanes sp.]
MSDKSFAAPRIFSAQTLVLGVLWSVFMAALIFWTAWQEKQHTMLMARAQARSYFDEVVYTRAWNSAHGGVYVFEGPGCCPNPYLTVPDAQIRTADGRSLVKINPAYMTRQLSDIAQDRGGVRFRMASLNPLRPGNKADGWETRAIDHFETGRAKDSFALATIQGHPVFRYIAPLEAEEQCLQCHRGKGILPGTILGGISVSFDAAPFLDAFSRSVGTIHVVFFLIWIAGLLGILTSTWIISKKNAELALANNAKALFMANMCHDMRTPLVGIMGVAERLLRRGPAPDEKRLTELVGSSASSLLEIVNDITDYSRLEQMSVALRAETFDLHELVDQALEIFRFESERKHVAFGLFMEDNVPAWVRGDGFRFKQILTNIVGNAVKFTDAGAIRVTMRARDDATRGEGCIMLETVVTDTGQGIAPGQEEAIFGSFFQGDSSLAKKHVGSGLGLAICRKLVGMMGGTISATNTEQGGACFRFTVALEVAEQPESGTRKTTTANPGRNAMTPPQVSILVAEDNPLNQIYVRELLEDAGHTVRVVETGILALEALQKTSSDMVFMDVQMPELDGLETTRRIRTGTIENVPADIPIIGLTALTLDQDMNTCMKAGMDGCLSKPVSETALLDTVSSIMADRSVGHDETSKPDEPPLVNRESALERLGGRENLYAKMATTFLVTAPQTMDELESACAQKNTPEILRLAHSLKNSAGSLGLDVLQQSALELEQAARNDDTHMYGRQIALVRQVFTQTIRILGQEPHS